VTTIDPKRNDYYALLGIDQGASVEEIGRAYRRAARATHPDAHPDEPSAGERFVAITLAYETLSDPARRATYDRARPAAGRPVRVEPFVRRPANPADAPIPVGRTPGIHEGVVRDDILELAALMTRLLRLGWYST
jgi:curved DNA-binding protein CbpA